MIETQERRMRLWQGTVETEVHVSGHGSAVVFLHGPWGLPIDKDFVDRLAREHTVYAPMHPGTSPGAPEAVHELDGIHDLVVYYGELLDQLADTPVPLIGHSFGAMLACEIAAAVSHRVSSLVLIAPVGLWRDDAPVRNWMIVPEVERRVVLFAQPDTEAARAFAQLPDKADERADVLANFIWAQACTGKFVWPIPDKGLKKRIHRIATPTLIVWGDQDRIVPSSYAREFQDRIPGSRVELIEAAGHMPHLEQPDLVVDLVRGFLRQ